MSASKPEMSSRSAIDPHQRFRNNIALFATACKIIAAPINCGSVWVRFVDEVPGAAFDREITAYLPGATLLSSPRLYGY